MPLFFPRMHPRLLSADARQNLPDGVRFLEPGLARSLEADQVRSARAPFDQRSARALLADMLRFGEEQASPRDILAQSLAEQAGALSPEGGTAVQQEVERRLLGPETADVPQGDEAAALKQAQLLLLLTWSLEERLLDLRGVEDRLRSAWSRLDESVAAGPEVVDDEADQEALALGRELSGLTPPRTERVALPWRKLLEAYALLMPGEALCTDMDAIADELAESGAPEGPLDAVPGAERVYRASLWRLMGLGAAPADRPWLAAEATIGVLPQGGQGE